jgi:anthranilate phosphoribosyltransferase
VADGTLPGTGEGSLADRLTAGLGHAARSVDDGAASTVLERWVAATGR